MENFRADTIIMIFFRQANSSENGLVLDVPTICAAHSLGRQVPDQ